MKKMKKQTIVLAVLFTLKSLVALNATDFCHFPPSQEGIIVHSFKTQIFDLRFKDYSDPLGVLKQEYIYGESRISLPLYEIKKDNQPMGYILGSCHTFPLTLLSESQRDILLSQEVLILEALKEDPTRQELLDWGCIVDSSASNRSLSDFFDGYDFDINIIRQVVWQHKFLKNGYIQEKEITPFGFAIFCMSVFQNIGIDASLQNIYNHQIPLEDGALREKTCGSALTLTQEKIKPDVFTSILYDIAEMMSLSPQHIGPYLSTISNEAFYFNKDNPIVERNIHWMGSLPTLLESNRLVCVGALHLFGKYGVLEFLSQYGFSFRPYQ